MKSANQPVSVRLDPQLKRRAAAYAKRHKVGLTTGLRMIISEHLDAEESAAELDAAHRWQREHAWETLKRLERGDVAERTMDDLRATHRNALQKARRR
jgi:hypothetical protein